MVAEKMGLGAQLEEPDFLKNMVKEMEQIHADTLGMLGEEDEEGEGDGEVSFDEFVSRLALPCSPSTTLWARASVVLSNPQ